MKSGTNTPWLMLCALASACVTPETDQERLEPLPDGSNVGPAGPATRDLQAEAAPERQTEGFDMEIDAVGDDLVLTFADQPGASQYTLWQSSEPYFAPGDADASAVDLGSGSSFTITGGATATDDAYWRVTTDNGASSTTVGRWVQALGPGYNMLGFPLLTGETLAAESFNAAHPELTEIWVYDNESDGFDIWYGTGEEDLSWSAGDSIAVLNGGGADVLRHFGHVPVEADLAFELPQNRSMVTLPLSMDPLDAQGLSTLMPSVSIVSTYDQPTQARLDFYPPQWGTNFAIEPGQGVMLTLDAPMLWPPGYTPPEPAAGVTLVTNYDSPDRDSFQICDRDDAGAWACEVVTLPEWATWIRGDHNGVQLDAIDANGDGVSGFVTLRQHAIQCEFINEAWTCAELDNGAQDYRRIYETDVFDFDGDGFDDLVYSQTDNGPQVCYGGTFPMQCQGLGIGGSQYHASDYADFDADGNRDVYLSYRQPWNTGHSQLCFGDGQGGYACENFTASTTSSSSANTDAAAFDANADGLPDLYVEFAPIYGAAGELCLNDPAAPGSFSCSPVDLPSLHYNQAPWGQGSNDVTVADMDGDGDEDLAMGSRGAPYVCWNEGTGVLDCDYLDGVSTYSDLDGAVSTQLELVDVDGDGLLDIIQSGLALTLHVNQGDRTFAPETILDGTAAQIGVAVLSGATP